MSDSIANKISNVLIRFIADFFLFTMVFILPWWATLLFGWIMIFFFRRYYEFVFASVAVTILFFGVPGHKMIFFILPLVFSILFIATERFKSLLVINNQ